MSRIRANQITNQAADGAPTVQHGLIISGVTTVTGSINNLNLTGITTISTLDLNGDLDVDGHLNADNVSIAGVVTATTYHGSGANLTGLSGVSVANQADNRLITATGTTDALNGEANLTYDGTSLLLGSGAVATPKVTQAGSLDLDSGGISLCIGGNENSNGRTNSTNKLNRVVTPHYTNAEEPMAMISGYSTSGQSQLFYGGGSGLTNAVTEHNFYTTANTTTTSGTKRLRIRSNGEIQIGSIDTPSASRGALAVKASNDAQSVGINFYLQEVSGGEGYGIGVDGDGDLNFYNGGATSPTLEIRDDNNVAITDGNLVLASGHGIDFSATSDATHTGASGANPTTDSEKLTDYEHGTWTPRLRAYDHSGGAGWGTMKYTDGTDVIGSGRYVRMGNHVWCGFKFESGSKVFDSNWTYWSIDNTPYGANHYDKASGSLYVSQTNFFTDSNSHIGGFVHGNESYMVVNKPNGHSNATINTSNNNRYCYGHISIYTSRT